MNYIKHLKEFRKYTGYDAVYVSFVIEVPDVGEIYRDAELSDAELTQAAIVKGKTTWDEQEICEALGLTPV